ncbi:hypothetical protein INT45_000243 [Circinella minor]|uniref:Uncharacterized protein n=1 Tax=Circinella minor TaxID=1195481 RepID=A0A8H7S4A2_9FUNG|nr:hypothetical protein INT45_000243 [Circinella minor]
MSMLVHQFTSTPKVLDIRTKDPRNFSAMGQVFPASTPKALQMHAKGPRNFSAMGQVFTNIGNRMHAPTGTSHPMTKAFLAGNNERSVTSQETAEQREKGRHQQLLLGQSCHCFATRYSRSTEESSTASTSSKKRLINLSSSTSHLKIPSLSEEESSTRLSSDSLPSTSNPLTETENSPKHATDTSLSTPSGRLSSAPKLNDTPPSLFSPTKSGLLHSPVPILETNAMSEVVETDGIVCDTTKLSIATIIKREATNFHDQYKHGNPLSSRQRKIMSNGLSSILDLVDQSYTSQRKLFTSAEWQQINQLFQNKHHIPDTSPLNPTLSTTL